MKHSLAIMESQHDFLYPHSILLPHNLPRRSTGNTVSTSIIKAVQKRTKSVLQVIFHEKFVLWHRWKKRQWKKGARRCCRQRKQTVCARQRDEMGKDMVTQKRMRRQWRREKVRLGWLGVVVGFNSWQKGHTYCRAHTHTGPPGTCRSLGRGLGRHLNPWSQCTGSDCCICKKQTETDFITLT